MERIKGIRGCSNRSSEVFDWLVDRGWNAPMSSFTRDDFWDNNKIYYTVDGGLFEVTLNHHIVKLLDVEELPAWRADRGDTYYFVADWLDVCEEEEHYYNRDEMRWKCGNYFSNRTDALTFLEKICAVRKEIKM